MPHSPRDKSCQGGVQHRGKESNILLPYGEAQNGRILHISEVPSGLRCKCKCLDCSALLVARKGSKKEHHFAHHSGTACGISLETALHKVAKQIIADRQQVWLPEVKAIVGEEERVRHKARMFQVNDVTVEQWLDGLRPDIIVRKDGHELLVEVAVTHFCDERKLTLIRQRQLAAIEIDLSRVPRGASRIEIEDAILRSARRRWFFNPHQEELTSKMVTEQKHKAAQTAARKDRAIRNRTSGLLTAWSARPDTAAAKSARDATAPQLAELADAKLLDEIGHDVGGDRCFTVDRRAWQAAVLHYVINLEWPNAPVKATDILKLVINAGLIKAGLVGFVEKECSDHARGMNLNFMSPFEAIEEYLRLLETRGILKSRLNGYPVADTERVRNALVSVKNARTGRGRVADVRRAVDSLFSNMGSPLSIDSAVWMRTLNPGLDDTPEIVAARSPVSADRLLDHIGRLSRMLCGTGSVEENLLGLPLEEAREQRRAAIEAKAIAAQLQEERRRAAIAAREHQEAEARRDQLVSLASNLLGFVEGEKFVIRPFDCLGSRSLGNIDGLNEEQARMVDRALEKEHRRLQAVWRQEQEVEYRRARLQKAAESALGVERAAVWMKASHPSLSGKRPQEVAVVDGGLDRCLALLPTRGSNRR